MGHPVGGALRAVRGLALALVVVGIAATAHVAGGGDLPPGLLLAGVVVATAFAAHAVTARRVTLPVAVLALGAGQVVLHTAFTALAASPASGVPQRLAALQVHVHGGAHPLPPMATDPSVLADPSMAGGSAAGAAMLVLHVFAVLVSAVVVAGAERSLWLLLAWLAPLAQVLAAAAAAVVPRLRRRVAGTLRVRPSAHLLARSAPRRGPPLLAPAPA